MERPRPTTALELSGQMPSGAIGYDLRSVHHHSQNGLTPLLHALRAPNTVLVYHARCVSFAKHWWFRYLIDCTNNRSCQYRPSRIRKAAFISAIRPPSSTFSP